MTPRPKIADHAIPKLDIGSRYQLTINTSAIRCKIDGSFVSIVADSIVDEKIVSLAHEIAHLMGKKTIAEWVENKATADVLARIGVDYLQGHWIAYPRRLDGSFRSMH
jgi:EAL domain-containing protein (putative c-di-GMP-specific phosphodiesterase class I)